MAAIEEWDILTQRSIFTTTPSKLLMNNSVSLPSKRKLYRTTNDSKKWPQQMSSKTKFVPGSPTAKPKL